MPRGTFYTWLNKHHRTRLLCSPQTTSKSSAVWQRSCNQSTERLALPGLFVHQFALLKDKPKRRWGTGLRRKYERETDFIQRTDEPRHTRRPEDSGAEGLCPRPRNQLIDHALRKSRLVLQIMRGTKLLEHRHQTIRNSLICRRNRQGSDYPIHAHRACF